MITPLDRRTFHYVLLYSHDERRFCYKARPSFASQRLVKGLRDDCSTGIPCSSRKPFTAKQSNQKSGI
jgi:hypothetical protein